MRQTAYEGVISRQVATADPALIEAVRIDYRADEISLVAMQKKHHLTESRLKWMIEQQGWPRRSPKPLGRARIIARMFRLLEWQIDYLETNMKTTGEKEVTVLGRLAGTLGRLIDIENKAGKSKPSARQARDMLDIRNRLIKRIEQLKRQ